MCRLGHPHSIPKVGALEGGKGDRYRDLKLSNNEGERESIKMLLQVGEEDPIFYRRSNPTVFLSFAPDRYYRS
jgi:hypothetical protein